MLVNNIIYGFKHIEGFVIFNKNNKLVTSIYKRKGPFFDVKTRLEKLKSSGTTIDTFESNNKTYFLYLIENYENNMNVLFLLEPDYFNTGFDSLNIKYKFFIFDRNYSILNSNINDQGLLIKLGNAIQFKTFDYEEKIYSIKFLPLNYINLYTGILFEKYPIIYMALNLLKWLLIIVVLYFLCLGIKMLYEKLMDIRLKQKPSEMELVTGAMIEVAKSIKSATNLTPPSTVNINQKDIEKVVSNAFSKYIHHDQGDEVRINNNNKQDVAGWKLIK